MGRAKLNIINEEIQGEFLDTVIPKLDWIKFELIHKKTKWQNSKTLEIQKVEDNFSITIDVSENVSSEDKELSSKIQSICKLSFPPYYWQTKNYKFYTTERTGSLDVRKEILRNLFETLTTYEVEKKAQFSESNLIFKADMKQNVRLETPELLMKLHAPTKRFVVLAKDFIGPDKYSLLRKASEYSSYLVPPENVLPSNINKYALSTDFFAEDLPGKKLDKKTYFVINPSYYEKIKHHFNFAVKEHKEFLEKQKRISEEHDLSQYNIETENVFGLKVKFIPENQCFEFYGKGYFDNEPYNGNVTPRSLIGLWGLNFVYSEENTDPNVYPQDEVIEGKIKIELDEVKGGSRKDKNVRIPASEWPKIKKIKENFEQANLFWSRPESSIKITHCDFTGLCVFDRYPAVYFDKNGDSYLAFGSRRMGKFKDLGNSAVYDYTTSTFVPDLLVKEEESDSTKKKPRNSKFSITMKAIPITFDEVRYFMNDHPFAERIKEGTFNLNVRLHAEESAYYVMTYEEKQEIFNTIYLHAEIHGEAKKNQIDKPKTKRLKI